MKFIDSAPKKNAFEVVSDFSSHEIFTEQIDIYKLENISIDTESTHSKFFYHNKDGKGSIEESLEINSEVSELGNASVAAINMNTRNNDFYMLDVAGNIGDMDPIQSCKEGFESCSGIMNNVCIIQDSSEEESLSDSLDSLIYMKNERINYTIGNV